MLSCGALASQEKVNTYVNVCAEWFSISYKVSSTFIGCKSTYKRKYYICKNEEKSERVLSR